MPERFKDPPLAELAAELRWASGVTVPMSPSAGQVIMVSAGQYEDFFMRFSSKIGALGYDRVERIVPPGFPAPPFQATYRFRKKDYEEGTTIYQVGGGVFTTNITPPYHSWEQFRPVIQRGVECLLETRNEPDRQTPFGPLILRYINAFTSKFTKGRSAASFVRDMLGFTVNLPQALHSEMASDAEVKLHLQLAIPVRPGQQMNVVLAEGLVSGEQALIMDLSVVADTPIAPRTEEIMATFDAARGVIHRVFVGMTPKLYPIMQPMQGENE